MSELAIIAVAILATIVIVAIVFTLAPMKQPVPAPLPPPPPVAEVSFSPSGETAAVVAETIEDPEEEINETHNKGTWSEIPWVQYNDKNYTLDYTTIKGFQAEYNDFGTSCLCIGVVWAPRPDSATFGFLAPTQYKAYINQYRENLNKGVTEGKYGTNEKMGRWIVPNLAKGSGGIPVETIVFEKPAKSGCPVRSFALRGPVEECNRANL